MADQTEPSTATEIVDDASEEASNEAPVSEPAKVMRIGSMIRLLLEEVRSADLDEAGRRRMGEIYDTALGQLSEAISEDLRQELAELARPFADDTVPSRDELRLAQAQLVGWLEGLFHGIQATLFAQQMAARQQLQQVQTQGLPAGGGQPGPGQAAAPPGVYL